MDFEEAYRVKYSLFHDASCCCSYLKPLYDLEQVVEFLGYQDHSVWRQNVEVAKQDRSLQSLLCNAMEPGSRNEASFSILFSVLPPMIAYAIEPEFDMQYLLKTRCKTGGYLACSEYDLISRRDLYYTTYANGKAVFETEVKAVASFPHDDAWYHDNRSAQVFSALNSLNAPLLLVTPNIFKLFIENEDRNRVFTYPFRSDVDPRHGSKEVALCHEQLVGIIVLLLLRPGILESTDDNIVQELAVGIENVQLASTLHSSTSAEVETFCGGTEPPKHDDPSRSKSSSKQKIMPKLFVGCVDGKDEYAPIRVYEESQSELEEMYKKHDDFWDELMDQNSNNMH